MEIDEKTFTVQQVASFLNIHYTKVYKLIKQGKLSAFNSSSGSKRNNWRILNSSLLAFMEQGKNKQEGE